MQRYCFFCIYANYYVIFCILRNKMRFLLHMSKKSSNFAVLFNRACVHAGERRLKSNAWSITK